MENDRNDNNMLPIELALFKEHIKNNFISLIEQVTISIHIRFPKLLKYYL